MSATNSNENKTPEGNISDELNELGKNLREALHAAWQSDERKKVQKEIEVGLANLGASLSKAAEDFSNSPAGQNLKEDVKDMQERWRSGEMGKKARSELMDVLHKVNDELQKATRKPPESKPGA